MLVQNEPLYTCPASIFGLRLSIIFSFTDFIYFFQPQRRFEKQNPARNVIFLEPLAFL